MSSRLPPPPPSFGGHVQNVHPDGDAAIRQTDSDAALARWSAVQKRYLNDPFIKPLLPRGAHLQPSRPPLINVGTYVRGEAIDQLVNQFVDLAHQERKQCQIVSLGAGSDTRFWRIASGSRATWVAKYIEVDFAENTTRKAMAIRKSKELSALMGKPESVHLGAGGTALHSPVYHLLPADLRRPASETIAPLITTVDNGASALLSPELPTLLLFECVLVYMTPEASAALIQWFVDHFARSQVDTLLGSIVYEMFGLNDPFGKVMLNNLQARNVTLPGAEPYPDVASLTNRYTRHGFNYSQARTLREIRRSYISAAELERISQLEMLDEVEELDLVLEHYAITWGFTSFGKDYRSEWKNWGLTRRS